MDREPRDRPRVADTYKLQEETLQKETPAKYWHGRARERQSGIKTTLSGVSSGVSKRTWVLLGIWTVVALTVGIVGHYTFNPPTDEDFIFGTDVFVNGFLFLCWFVGLFVIIFVLTALVVRGEHTRG